MADVYYCTTYCNQSHTVDSGHPLNHECYILPPRALRLEMEGKFHEAIEAITHAKPLRAHRGTKCRHDWMEITVYGRGRNWGCVTELYTGCRRCLERKAT